MNKKELQRIIFKLTPLICADIKLTEAIKLILEISNKKEKVKVRRLLNKIESGKSLVNAFKELSNDVVFLNYISMIEKGVDIKEIFSILNEKYTNEDKLKKEIFSLISYPIIVLTLSIAVFFAIVFFVLPKYINIYESLNIELPIYTKILVYVNKKIHIFLIILLSSIFLIYIFIKNNLKIFLKVDLFREYYLFKFTQNMKYLLEAKIDFLSAINLSKEINNKYLYEIFCEVQKELIKGKSFSNILTKYAIFNNEFIGIIKVGEKTSSYLVSFDNLYNIYRFKVEMKMKMILKLLEPFSILFVSMIIAFSILAIMLPLFNLGGKIS